MLAVSFFSSFATVYIIDPSIKEFFLGKGDESVQVLLQIDAQPSNDSDIKNERDASSKNHNESLSQAEKLETTFIATGINVIIVIVTIWAGLNIINALTKSDIADIENKAKNFEEYRKQTEIEVTNLKQQISRNEFIRLLLEETDSSSIYVYELMMNTDIPFDLMPDLIKLESYYIASNKINDSINEDNNELSKTINKGLNIVDNLTRLNSIDDDIRKYLMLRKAQLCFNMGYANERYISAQEKYEAFYNAQKILFAICKSWNIQLPSCSINPDDNTKLRNIMDKYNDKNKFLGAYFSNMIGESCSKIVQIYENNNIELYDETIESVASKALLYCTFSTVLINDYTVYEVYFRNRGCAYERYEMLLKEDFKFEETILECYYESYRRMTRDTNIKPYRIRNVYSVILCYYDKICDAIKNDNIKLDERTIKKYADYINKYWIISEKAIIHRPQFIDFYYYRGKLLTFLIWLHSNNMDVFKQINISMDYNGINIEIEKIKYTMMLMVNEKEEKYKRFEDFLNN